jgi:hypothetical protein
MGGKNMVPIAAISSAPTTTELTTPLDYGPEIFRAVFIFGQKMALHRF